MREIKFRGKSFNNVSNSGWVYGSLIKMDSKGSQSFIFPLIEYASTLTCGQLIRNHMEAVKPETVGQSTGLPDRNGKEIFDGDVVEGEKYSGKPGIYNNHTGVVKFRHESFSSFGINQYKGQEAKINSLFEIIGNIYDNPELLEVVK